jgi:hypothetical protein
MTILQLEQATVRRVFEVHERAKKKPNRPTKRRFEEVYEVSQRLPWWSFSCQCMNPPIFCLASAFSDNSSTAGNGRPGNCRTKKRSAENTSMFVCDDKEEDRKGKGS